MVCHSMDDEINIQIEISLYSMSDRENIKGNVNLERNRIKRTFGNLNKTIVFGRKRS